MSGCQAFNLRTGEADAGRSVELKASLVYTEVPDHPGLPTETVSQKEKENERENERERKREGVEMLLI